MLLEQEGYRVAGTVRTFVAGTGRESCRPLKLKRTIILQTVFSVKQVEEIKINICRRLVCLNFRSGRIFYCPFHPSGGKSNRMYKLQMKVNRNGPLSVVSYVHDVFPSESEFPDNLLIFECQYQTDRFCP